MSMRSKNMTKIFWGAALVLTPAIIYAANLTVPNSFSANTPIVSAQMNANFAAVQTAVNSKQDITTVSCSANQAVTAIANGSATCSAVGGGGNFVANQTTPTQSASFNISGSGFLGGAPGVAVPPATLQAVGSAAVTGIGTVGNPTVGSTVLAGAVTVYFTQASPGDVVNIPGIAAADRVRRVATVTSNTNLTVDLPYTTTFTGQSFTIQKPIGRFDQAGGAVGLFVNGLGSVGVGTDTPANALDVSGNARVTGNLSAGLIFMGTGTANDCPISPSGGTTDCTCPAGYYAVSGGGWGNIGVYLRESRPLSPTTWRISCNAPGFSARSDVFSGYAGCCNWNTGTTVLTGVSFNESPCVGMNVICSRVAP